MAPANGSSKSRKANNTGPVTSKPAPKKPVVPALPLKRHTATASSASSVANAAGQQKPEQKTKKHEEEKALPIEEKTANGADEPVEAVSDLKMTAASSKKEPSPEESSTAHRQPPHHESSESSATPKLDTPTTVPSTDDENNATGSTVASITEIQQAELEKKHNDVSDKGDPRQKASVDLSAKPFRPRPPPAVSPSRYQMAPPFQPNNRSLGISGNGEVPRGHRGPVPSGPHHAHQAHPSNSSIHFGTFHDSQTSSPIPHTGGVAPPPGMPFPDGRQPFMGPGGNGFPPMMPYGNEMMPVTTFDNYGRPSMAYAPMEAYPHYRGNMGPGLSGGPHSFHGSQSSNADESAMFNQFARAHPRNGVPGQNDDNQHPNARGFRPHDYPPMFPNQGIQPQIMNRVEGDDELVQHFRHQFGNPEFADFTLELRYIDDRAAPVRIPGHRIVFSRSADLAGQLRRQTLPPSPSGGSSQTLLLETGSKWIRSDSFWMAVQSLYGVPLLANQVPRPASEAGELTDAGSSGEQLDFALSYAAAGHLLGWGPVVRRGCEVATQLLNWQTVERVLEFALEGYKDKGLHDTYKYGDGSKLLLDSIVTFIVHNFPPTFELDANVAEPVQYARLPISPGPGPVPPPEVPSSPTNSSSPSVQLGKGRRSQKITGIQFGDFAAPDSKVNMESETPKAPRQAQPVSHGVLSRLLLNIPFTQLKMVLESSGSGNVQGWANAESRYRIVKTAVDERESLRLRALQAVMSGRVADAPAILETLRAPEPRDTDRWGILGWQEEILPYGNADGPSLGRKWSPLTGYQATHSEAAYP